MENIRIALAQICPEPGKNEENAEKMVGYMKEAAKKKADLIVFPECSLTGYAPERAEKICLESDDNIINKVRNKADELGIAICFGYAEKNPAGRPFIAQELYERGKKTIYCKTHIAPREEGYFEAGNDFPSTEVSGIKVAMQICWESHMPRISALYRKNGAQLLLFPYASGMSGEKCKENWSIHLPARASDNGCFAAACNLLSNGKGGGLAVWDPKGKLIAQYWGFDEEMIVCDIGGELPREILARGEETMHSISYFDHAKEEL